MEWRRWSFLCFILACSLAKTSGLNGCLYFNRCHSTRANLCAMAVMALGLPNLAFQRLFQNPPIQK